MSTEREKQSEFMPPQLTARRSVRWRGLGMIVTGVGLAMLLATVGTGEEPKSVVANGGNGTSTPTVSVATRIAELSTQQAKNEKDLADLKTQEAVLSATPTPQSGIRVEVTVVTGPNQPSINIGIDQDFNFPSGQVGPTPKPEIIVVTATPISIEPTTSEAVTAIETIVQGRLDTKGSATARASAPTLTPTPTATPTSTSAPTPKPAEEGPPWGWIAGAFAAGTAITAELWNGFTRKKWFIIR